MNKFFKLFLTVLLIVVTSLGIKPLKIEASTLTAPGSETILVGTTKTISISTQPNYGIEVTVGVSDSSVISLSKNGSDDSFNGSAIISIVPNSSFVVKGLKVGKSTIRLKGVVVSSDEVSVDKTIVINVIEPEKPTPPVTPKPEVKPTPGPKPTPPKLDSTEADKIAPTISPEELAKQEAERKEKELEALRKIPLISDVEIISQSEKYQGDVLETLKATDNVFDFEYTLPKRIDEFSLNINAPEDVTLTYDEKYKFEAEENEKTVVVKASKGEVDQTFNVLVKRNVFESVEKTVFESAYAVYDDERLDDFVKTLKAEKIDETHFKFDDLLFQLVVDEDNNAKWLLLNEDLSEQAFGLIHLNDDGEVLFILESDDLASETLYGEKYSNKELVLDERISAIDPSLKFETTYKGTNFEDGVIVYAMNSKGIKGNHFISSDNSFTFAAVAFDQVNMTYKYVAWGSSIALIALVGALVLTKVLERKKSI